MYNLHEENSNNSNKNIYMNEITNLKIEAKSLLDELNHKAEGFSDKYSNSPNEREYYFEEQSFKERLKQLKKRFSILQISLSNHSTIT